MNTIWLENGFRPLEPNNRMGNCYSATTKDGMHVYVPEKSFENFPKFLKETFYYLENFRFKDIEKKTWVYICQERRAENLKHLLPEDVLKLIAIFLDKSTKVAFACASHILKRNCPKVKFKKICNYAAAAGHLEILKWARHAGASFSIDTCSKAAKGGHLDVLKWARGNGASWDWRVCAFASRWDRLEVLKWAKANGAPWSDSDLSIYASEGGHVRVLKWAKDNGALLKAELIRYYSTDEVYKWLKEEYLK